MFYFIGLFVLSFLLIWFLFFFFCRLDYVDELLWLLKCDYAEKDLQYSVFTYLTSKLNSQFYGDALDIGLFVHVTGVPLTVVQQGVDGFPELRFRHRHSLGDRRPDGSYAVGTVLLFGRTHYNLAG